MKYTLSGKLKKKLVNKNAIKFKIGELPGNLVQKALTPKGFFKKFGYPPPPPPSDFQPCVSIIIIW